MVTKCGAEQFLHNVEDFTARYFLIQLNIVPLLTHTTKHCKKNKVQYLKMKPKAVSVNAIPPKKLLNFFFNFI